MVQPTLPQGVELKGPIKPGYERVMTPAAIAFVVELERKFGCRAEAPVGAPR